MENSYSMHEFFFKPSGELAVFVEIDECAIKDGEPKIFTNTKIRIENPEFQLEISLPRKAIKKMMDLLRALDSVKTERAISDKKEEARV